MATIKPPKGFRSWLHYAVASMDTKSPNIESIVTEGDADANWDREISRDEIRDAAIGELQNVLSEKAMAELKGFLLSREDDIATSEENFEELLYVFREVMGRDPREARR